MHGRVGDRKVERFARGIYDKLAGAERFSLSREENRAVRGLAGLELSQYQRNRGGRRRRVELGRTEIRDRALPPGFITVGRMNLGVAVQASLVGFHQFNK